MLSKIFTSVLAVRLLYFAIAWSIPVTSFSELPVACGAVNCGGNATQFVSSGTAELISDGINATIRQQTERAILNWQSFNIGKNNKVKFDQPSVSSAALNRIFQGVPSQILGSIEANGQVFLINNNGIVFGEGAQVNVGGLTASTLNLSDNVFLNLNVATAINEGLPAFSGGSATDAVINFEEGSSVATASGQRILAIAPEVINSGELITPNGQTILAGASDSVYLFLPDSDSEVRGLLVEVATGGSVENLGKIVAERGNITLIGQAVRQAGSVSATTSVNENGSIRLLARDGAVLDNPANPSAAQALSSGTLELAEDSLTEILPDYDSSDRAQENQEQQLSTIELAGKTIEFGRNSVTRAIGGNIEVTALQNPQSSDLPAFKTDSRILVNEGSVIDVSGDDTAVVSASQNQASISIRANELANFPAQKDGPLLDEEIQIDVRFGTDVADVSNAITGVERTVEERLSVGGTINMTTDGDVILKNNSLVDISGGQIEYTEGIVETSQLIVGNDIVDISIANRDIEYDSLSSALRRKLVPGYIEGKDGGSFNITANDVVFNGAILGDITRGMNQRQLTGSLNDRPAYTRAFNQAPQSSKLSIDLSSFLTRDVEILSSNQITNIASDFGIDTLLSNDHVLQINASSLNNSGIGQFALSTLGSVAISSNISLSQGGSIDISAGDISVDNADITVHAGSISLATENPLILADEGSITIANDSELSTTGLWINDFNILSNIQQSALNNELLSINAGNININAEGNVFISNNSLLNASAGAYLDSNNNLTAGDAGDISIAANLTQNQSTITNLNPNSLSSYGINKGGRLRLESSSIVINNTGDGTDPNTLYISDDFFSRGGFSEFGLVSNRDGFIVSSTARIEPEMVNVSLSSNSSTFSSGSELIEIGSLQVLPDYIRQPISLVFESSQSSIFDDSLKGLSNLVVEQGSYINLGVGGSIDLISDNSIYFDGRIDANAGNIRLSIVDPNYSGRELGFLDTQALWLGTSAYLNTSGAVIETPNFGNPLLNDINILDAGNITLDAQRGYVVAEEGAFFDISGVSRTYTQSRGIRFITEDAYADAGRIKLDIGEGLLFNADVRAIANSNARKGELALNVERKLFVDLPDLSTTNPLARLPLETTRDIEISSADSDILFAFGDSVPDEFNGKAFLNIDRIESSNIDSLNLVSTNSISFTENLALALARDITLDTPILNINSNVISINSPYISLGPTATERQFTSPTTLTGNGQLLIQADHLDISGNVAIDGASEVTFDIDGDIQLKGIYQRTLREIPSGTLAYAGELSVIADQLYPSTYSRFNIRNLDLDDGLFKMDSNSPYGAVLSAAGQLNIESAFIENSGVIRAPAGQITLNASEQLDLNDASVLSVSLENAVVPFGRTEAGDWVYTTSDGSSSFTFVFPSLPEKSISLNSDSINFNENATVDISGNGDLLSYEFVPGPNGTNDILDSAVLSNSYAISRINNTSYVPFDHEYSADFNLDPGSQIILLDGVAGLPAGRYALYPARYALLPNFYLVTKQDGYQGITESQTIQLSDGSTLVGGLLAQANTPIVEYQSEGYSIIPNTELSNFAQYDVTSANKFFANKNSTAPTDAGRIGFIATSNLTFLGNLQASSLVGNGGLVDIQSDNIAIVESNDTDVEDGFLRLVASSLSNTGSQSILIGGSRTNTDSGQQLSVASNQIQVFDNVDLSVNEIILAAIDSIELGQDAQIVSNGENTFDSGNADNITLNGDGALLRVSSSDQVSVNRNNVSGLSGSIRIDENANIISNNSISFDVTNSLNILGDVVADKSILFSTENIILTDSVIDNNEFDAAIIDTGIISNASAAELILSADQSIGLKLVNLDNIGNLVLDTANIYSADSQPGKIDSLNVTSLTIKNDGEYTAQLTSALDNSSSLSITSNRLSFENGNYFLNGYESLQLSASDGAYFDGAVSLTTNSTNIELDAPILESSTGSKIDINASEANFQLVNTHGIANSQAPVSYGSQYNFAVNSLNLDTMIVNHAGDVSISSNEDIIFGENAFVDLAGVSLDFVNSIEQISAGKLSIRSNNGSFITLENDSAIDISGDPLGGNAGIIDINIENGELDILGEINANSNEEYKKGQINIVANSLSDFSTLNEILNLGNVNNKRHVRVKNGDLIVNQNEIVTANQVKLVADTGAIIINEGGSISAKSTSDEISSIRLIANSEIQIANGAVLDASAMSGENTQGGNINLHISSLEGNIIADTGSTITSAGGVDYDAGELAVGILVDTTNSDNDNLSSRLSFLHTGEISKYIIQPYTSNTQIDNTVSQTDVSNAYASISSYIDRNNDAFDNSFNFDSFSYELGLEFQSNLLSTSSMIDLSSFRYEENPINLILRSAGNLTINHVITDGFTADRQLLDQSSSNITFIAGADLNSSDFGAIASDRSVLLDINQDVMTGTGDLSFISSGDINLNANVYTAGRDAGIGSIDPSLQIFLVNTQFGRDGGNISFSSGGNFNTEDKQQLVTQWLFRFGSNDFGNFVDYPTFWGVNYDLFDQGIATLGGGDIYIDVNGDVTGLNASIPTIALHQGDFGIVGGRATYTDNSFEIIGGGNLITNIGGNLQNSAVYVDSGSLNVNVRGGIGSDDQPGSGLVVGLGDAIANINSTNNVLIDGIFNPFLLPLSVNQNLSTTLPISFISETYYSTYTDQTSISVSSSAGNILYENNGDQVFFTNDLFIPTSGGDPVIVFDYLPGDIAFKSLGGDLIFSDDLIVGSAPNGNLDLIAYNDIRTNGNGPLLIGMSDLSSLTQPTFTNQFTNIAQITQAINISGSGPDFHATTPVHINDDEPSLITALNGSIFAIESDLLRILTAEATNIYAGKDLSSINLNFQNINSDDISSIQLGGSLRFPNIRRSSDGGLTQDNSSIVISGPGILQIIAAEEIDLGGSAGIRSIGNLSNPFLQDQGADVLLLAGVGLERSFLESVTSADFISILEQFRTGDLDDQLRADGVVGIVNGDRPSFSVNSEFTPYQRQQAGVLVDELEQIIQQIIISFAEQTTGGPVTLREATAIYDQSDQLTKRQVNSEIIFSFLRSSIELATIPTLNPSDIRSQSDLLEENWDLGFAIIEKFFPQNGLEQGEITLFNSTIQSLEGGAINLIVPGGGIDAGLPSVVEGARSVDEIGIISQGIGGINILARNNVAVNSSRIFAIGGGDVTIWSSLGNVDAGRGAQDSLRVPPPTTTIDENGNIQVEFSAAISGSGIGTFTTSDDDPTGSAFFGIPNGFLDAGAAGIRIAGDATFGAQEIRGTEAISIGGDSVAPGLSDSGPPIALTTQADSSSTAASDAATEGATSSAGDQQNEDGLANSALKWLEVFILGFGDEGEETASTSSAACDEQEETCES